IQSISAMFGPLVHAIGSESNKEIKDISLSAISVNTFTNILGGNIVGGSSSNLADQFLKGILSGIPGIWGNGINEGINK
ncbi:MAG: hypothetical protein KF880_00005, partial [Ferruginibacter sp.]|nr:hypothetical protein [Ferruginibacter sp.]